MAQHLPSAPPARKTFSTLLEVRHLPKGETSTIKVRHPLKRRAKRASRLKHLVQVSPLPQSRVVRRTPLEVLLHQSWNPFLYGLVVGLYTREPISPLTDLSNMVARRAAGPVTLEDPLPRNIGTPKPASAALIV